MLSLTPRRTVNIVVLGLLLLVGAFAVRSWNTPSAPDSPPPPPRFDPPPAAPAPSPAPLAARNVDGPVDLLAIADPARDAVKGAWSREGPALRTGRVIFGRLQFPCVPPPDYDLELVVQHVEGGDSLNVGLSNGSRHFMVVFDGNAGEHSGLDLINHRGFSENDTTFTQRVFNGPARMSFLFSVRRDGVAVSIDGRPVVSWKGSVEELGLYPGWNCPHPTAMFIGAYDTRFLIHRMVLTPRSGSSTLLR